VAFLALWQEVKEKKRLGFSDPIGTMDLYTFDMICMVESVMGELERAEMEKKMRERG